MPRPGAIRWDLAWQIALLAGVGAGLLSAIPVALLGSFLWLLAAGAITVMLYQRRVQGPPITAGMGMKLGGLAGAFAFVPYAVVTTVEFVRANTQFRSTMQAQMDKQIAGASDPKTQEIMRQMFDWIINTPQGMATFMVLTLIMIAVIFVLLAGAGGALGASLQGKRREFR